VARGFRSSGGRTRQGGRGGARGDGASEGGEIGGTRQGARGEGGRERAVARGRETGQGSTHAGHRGETESARARHVAETSGEGGGSVERVEELDRDSRGVGGENRTRVGDARASLQVIESSRRSRLAKETRFFIV